MIKAKIKEMTQGTHTFVQVPRGERRGGGVGMMLSKTCRKIQIKKSVKYDSFEYMEAVKLVVGKLFS